MKTHRDLQGWQKSMTLVNEVYKISKGFPKDEAYELSRDIERILSRLIRGLSTK